MFVFAEDSKNLDAKSKSNSGKTGIQALERIAPDKKTLPGKPVKLEVEYERHGTLCLIPSFDVASRQIIEYRIGDTRDEIFLVAGKLKLVPTDDILVNAARNSGISFGDC